MSEEAGDSPLLLFGLWNGRGTERAWPIPLLGTRSSDSVAFRGPPGPRTPAPGDLGLLPHPAARNPEPGGFFGPGFGAGEVDSEP